MKSRLRLRATRYIISLTAGLIATAVILAFSLQRTRSQLPYDDSFAENQAQEWAAYGGVWQLAGGAVFNRSDERGAKLITGSRSWTNYRLEGDLEMLGHSGDVGLILRVSDEELGIDSYDGYFVGLRSVDSALVMGRADHGWIETQPVPMPGGVKPSVWYRLNIVAVGCQIGAIATNLQTGQSAGGVLEESRCATSGKVGLRSMGTGGAWRHIRVTTARAADLNPILRKAAAVEHPIFPGSEAEDYKMHSMYFGKTYFPLHGYLHGNSILPRNSIAELIEQRIPLTPIANARSIIFPADPVRVRGVITLTSPVYIQDATGGIRLVSDSFLPLNLGDEIEATGQLILDGDRRYLRANSIRLLWDRTPTVPLSISSTQAASGAFGSSLVEIRGFLRSVTREANGALRLGLDDESQSFAAIIPTPLSSSAYGNWHPGSWLSVHGICVIRETFGSQSAAFTILARSPDDIEVLSGPPWWTGPRLFRLLVAVIVLILIGFFLVFKIERWRTKGIMDERERLAHAMHDTLAQNFAGVGFHLQGIRNQMRSFALAEKSGLLEKLDTACRIVAQTHREASASIAALHPDADRGVDLLVALERYAGRMLNATNFPMEISRTGSPREMSLPVRDALFQVGREAVTNAIRHSRAEKLSLALNYEARRVVLQVTDTGIGFNRTSGAGFGISAMRRRCEAIGAELQIESDPGAGTTVRVTSGYGQRHTLWEWLRHTAFRRPSPEARGKRSQHEVLDRSIS